MDPKMYTIVLTFANALIHKIKRLVKEIHRMNQYNISFFNNCKLLYDPYSDK